MKWPAPVPAAIALCCLTTVGPAPRHVAPLPNDLVARGQNGAVVTAEPQTRLDGLLHRRQSRLLQPFDLRLE